MPRLKKRPDGRYIMQVYLGRVDGKKKYKSVYGNTQKEAEENAAKLKQKLRIGLNIAPEKNLFSEWADEWLAFASATMTEKNYANYTSAVSYLKEDIGDIFVEKIRTIDIQSVVLGLAEKNPHTKKPTSKSRLNYVKSAAKQIFDLCIDNRILQYNPALAVKIPNTTPARVREPITKEQQRWVRDMDHRAQPAAMVMLYAGLRRGELVPLTWSDINLKKGTIAVNKSVGYVKNRPILKEGAKTDAGTRTVSIPKILVNYLSELPKTSVLFFPMQDGNMFTEGAWKRMWESYICDLNVTYGKFTDEWKPNGVPKKQNPKKLPLSITPFTPHQLRHTFASMMYMAGVDVLTTKYMMGHSDIKTTLNIYTKLDKKYKTEDMSKLDDFIEKRPEEETGS